ncbi:MULTISPECIES: NTP transferase domain-containing protein [unclassified Agrococcus]|uniref:phosphocholine cytidylyltransferase family protein n=1 Tax=unclassified Agrococcus TaxID=2615065 RepID=UPI0036108401
MTTQIVILAAGMGSRLGRSLPKSLTVLNDGRTIMQQQVENVRAAFDDARITTVVGYKADAIIDAFPENTYVYNDEYDVTNTSKSLLRALRASKPGGVLWMNGDVVFHPGLLARVAERVRADQSTVAVDTSKVSDEEVKYTLDARGDIRELSKTVKGGLGEAIGINYVSSTDKATLIRHLQRCDAQDYFERGLETAIAEAGIRVQPLDISDLFAVEVDFAEDLDRANLYV